MTRHRALALTVGVLFFLAVCPHASNSDEGTRGIYRRGARDLNAILRTLRESVNAGKYASILWVFDTVTFNPPPGASEFDFHHRYREDLDRWMDAVDSFAPEVACRSYVACTASREVIPVGGNAWRDLIQAATSTPWWKSPSFTFEPASAWVARLADQVGRRGMLVLVTGDILPERVVKGAFNAPSGLPNFRLPDGLPEGVREVLAEELARQAPDESWRSALLPVGEYWDEEKVGDALREHSSGLSVVAPEARFCDFLPVVEIPDVPWASRPVGTGPTLVLRENRDSIESKLRALVPDAEERRRLLDRALEAYRALDTQTVRFESKTPRFCDSFGPSVFFNTDCPSGFGYWPFARATAATGGQYFFYPFPSSPWLDVCPLDEALAQRLAPELVPKKEYLEAKRDDAALDAICNACRQVVADTPWTDSGESEHKRGPGWMSFRSTSPLMLHMGFPTRDRPIDKTEASDLPAAKPAAELRSEGQRLSRLVKRYDQAIAILDRAEKKFLETGGSSAHSRSCATLLLTRFWFEMSAFHLEALAILLREYKPVPEGNKQGDVMIVAYVPTVRLSDCLEGYAARELSPADEDRYGPAFVGLEGYQGNLLAIEQPDPNYRAKRAIEAVLKNLDPRLKPRALRMIRSAEAVMAGYARSPWGWVVYYSEADTFVSYPRSGALLAVDRHGGRLQRADTPGDRPGSSGAGPHSGGK